jgi:hypothetical protein
MPVDTLWMPSGFWEEQGEAPLSTVGLCGTWWLPSKSGASTPQVCSPQGGGWLFVRTECHTAWLGVGRTGIQTDVTGWYWWSAGNWSRISSWLVERMPWCWLWCPGWGWVLASVWNSRLQWDSMCNPLTMEGAPQVLCGHAENRLSVV